MEYHNFHTTPGYIDGPTPIIDHIYTNYDRTKEPEWGSRKRWVLPPKVDEAEVSEFADGLVITAQQKMTELLDRHDFLEQRRSNNVGVIQRVSDQKNWDEFTEYFYTYLENTHYTEVLYVHRWLKYWKKIYELAAKTQFEPVYFEKKDEITDEDVAKAKEYPIQELFDGNLRHSFGKLTGLCPFHEDSTPSFTIFENDNHFYCFGCNAWGDAIDFYMKTNHVSMIEAVKALNAK